MRLKFSKMQGLGNDFVIIDNTSGAFSLHPEQVRYLAHRRLGVGCDQLLLVEQTVEPSADLGMRVFNADGSEAEQCGNGLRCFALFVRDRGLTRKEEISIATAAGIVRSRVMSDGQVSVDMGLPGLAPESVPFIAEHRSSQYSLAVGDHEVHIGAVSMGNPHAVLRVEDATVAPVGNLGPLIQRHVRFPNGANVGFMQIMNPHWIRLRVYERGVGETLACGTGACAAVVVGRAQNLLGEKVDVDLAGGRLRVAWSGEGQSVWMTGPATQVFDGEIEIEP